MERKEELIKALESERDFLSVHGHDVAEYESALHYLRTGEYHEDEVWNNELLQGCVEDYDMMVADYLESRPN